MPEPRLVDANDPRFVAAIDLLRRTGMRQFQLRYADDEQPVVWMAVGKWGIGGDGVPKAKGGRTTYDAAGGVDPFKAVMRLCDQVLERSICAHCGRPSAVVSEWRSEMPLAELVCWYRYDPELETFRRSCEVDDA